MINRLSVILDKSQNKKFRNEYIKYLKSLDFEEFEYIFSYYSSVLVKLLLRYKKNKIRLFSKKWFILKDIQIKWRILYLLFLDANYKFVKRTLDNLEIKNSKRMDLIIKINETKQALDSIISNPIKLTSNPKKEDIIKFNLIIIDSIHTSEELTNLMDKLNNIK